MNRERVLFLCTGNTSRSQMAEAFLWRLGGDRFEVYSAGLEPSQINPYARRVMAEKGYDLAGQYSKDLSEYLGKVHFSYLITVCSDADAKCPAIFPGMGQRMHWGFDDPAAVEGTDAEKVAVFRRVRDEIESKIRAWLQERGLEPVA